MTAEALRRRFIMNIEDIDALHFYYYNLNSQFNDFYRPQNLAKDKRYPYIKAYIRSYLLSVKEQYDSDVSKKAMIFYKMNYPFLSKGIIQDKSIAKKYNRNHHQQQICCPNNDKNEYEYVFWGDTLNSMKHIFNNFLNKYCSKLPKVSEYYNIKWTNDDYEDLLEKFDGLFSDTNLSKVYCAKEILNQFEIFAKYSDTYGNIFPCLPKFNAERSDYGRNDFADLMLLSVYNYLKEDNKQEKRVHLEKLFCGIKDETKSNKKLYRKDKHINDSIERLTYYLETYYDNNWNTFVIMNRFEYNVNYNNEQKCFEKPKMLWTNHSFENRDYPKSEQEFLEMLRFINNSIIYRNNKIFNAYPNIKYLIGFESCDIF